VNRAKQAEHMAAPTSAARVKKALANPEPDLGAEIIEVYPFAIVRGFTEVLQTQIDRAGLSRPTWRGRRPHGLGPRNAARAQVVDAILSDANPIDCLGRSERRQSKPTEFSLGQSRAR
jgi:hypothetical protein